MDIKVFMMHKAQSKGLRLFVLYFLGLVQLISFLFVQFKWIVSDCTDRYNETMFGLQRRDDLLEQYSTWLQKGVRVRWSAPYPTLPFPAFTKHCHLQYSWLLLHLFLSPLSDGLLLEIHTPFLHKRAEDSGIAQFR